MARRTKEEALATRHRLLDAAELLFQQQGVSNTSLQQIAERAGATRGAIYWHFKDKADLFHAMMERVTLPLEADARIEDHPGEDPLDVIERGMLGALRQVTTDPQVRRVFEVATQKVEYAGETASLHRRHLESANACVADFEKALRLAARRSRVRLTVPAPMAAQGLHALIAGLIQSWLLDPEAFALVPAGRRNFNAFLAGLGFDRPGLRAETPPKLVAAAANDAQ
ncbi:TetR family transcriptional regulator [Variovorax rhizosphaerae]|uniref:TetR family transcriptional regulator n=1 Tax=Variovorax rhizosphaerae TaxID=1836200 RepID=A0ABU8WPM7_9BURK